MRSPTFGKALAQFPELQKAIAQEPKLPWSYLALTWIYSSAAFVIEDQGALREMATLDLSGGPAVEDSQSHQE